jgi:hypothetical protein
LKPPLKRFFFDFLVEKFGKLEPYTIVRFSTHGTIPLRDKQVFEPSKEQSATNDELCPFRIKT